MRRGRSGTAAGPWILAAAVLSAAVAGAVYAQEEDVDKLIERGAASYLRHCGSCHGVDGQGDGALAPYLKSVLPDLTEIAARNQGAFPFEEIYDIVDGREVPGHGTRAMPVWGPALRGLDAEADKRQVREKVVELVYYLKSIQPAIPLPDPKMGGGPG